MPLVQGWARKGFNLNGSITNNWVLELPHPTFCFVVTHKRIDTKILCFTGIHKRFIKNV